MKNGPGPDDDCLLNSNLSKCKAPCDENNVCNCPEGFIMNEDDNCYPDKSCPKFKFTCICNGKKTTSVIAVESI